MANRRTPLLESFKRGFTYCETDSEERESEGEAPTAKARRGRAESDEEGVTGHDRRNQRPCVVVEESESWGSDGSSDSGEVQNRKIIQDSVWDSHEANRPPSGSTSVFDLGNGTIGYPSLTVKDRVIIRVPLNPYFDRVYCMHVKKEKIY